MHTLLLSLYTIFKKILFLVLYYTNWPPVWCWKCMNTKCGIFHIYIDNTSQNTWYHWTQHSHFHRRGVGPSPGPWIRSTGRWPGQWYGSRYWRSPSRTSPAVLAAPRWRPGRHMPGRTGPRTPGTGWSCTEHAQEIKCSQVYSEIPLRYWCEHTGAWVIYSVLNSFQRYNVIYSFNTEVISNQ